MISTALKKQLKARAHHLKPVILLGAKGLTEAVLKETDLALTIHELIKVKLSGIEKDERDGLLSTICSELKADLVQLIGKTAIIYRKNPEE